MENNIKRDIELLFEVGAFRFIDRAWKQFLNPDVANNAEHTFRTLWIALTIAKYEKNVDTGKLLKMALVHDIPESRCGDAHYLSRQYVEQDEMMAIEDVFEKTIYGSDMKELMVEYKERQSIESKIVKDADNIDVELELKELEFKGHSLGKIWEKGRQERVYPSLYTKTARLLWDEIKNSNPHNWHLNSNNNRFRGGDWKKK